jgi:predicted dehydrogenase
MLKMGVILPRMVERGFVYRKWPATAFARELIESVELGEVVHYRGHFFHDYGLDPTLPATLRLQKASRVEAAAPTSAAM